jgi:hypothetical protein
MVRTVPLSEAILLDVLTRDVFIAVLLVEKTMILGRRPPNRTAGSHRG